MSAQISLDALPRWASIVVLPLLNLVAAFTVAALVLLAVGESPAACLQIVIDSALLSGNGLQFTLFYATGFIFTGLAVSLAIHAGLFNIGGEGQVYLAGLGITLASFMAASISSITASLLIGAGVPSASSRASLASRSASSSISGSTSSPAPIPASRSILSSLSSASS